MKIDWTVKGPYITCIHVTDHSKMVISIYLLRRWDVLTGDLELVETKDAHSDIVYGKYEAKYKTLYVQILILA